jgi:hypothetical protein
MGLEGVLAFGHALKGFAGGGGFEFQLFEEEFSQVHGDSPFP